MIKLFDTVVLDSGKWDFSKFNIDFFWDKPSFSYSPLMELSFGFLLKTVLIARQCYSYS